MVYGLKTDKGELKIVANSINEARREFNKMGYFFYPKKVYRISMDNFIK